MIPGGRKGGKGRDLRVGRMGKEGRELWLQHGVLSSGVWWCCGSRDMR